MGVDLLKHNQEAFQEINNMLESGIKRIAIPRATGSGKTYLMGALAEKYNDEPKIVLEPSRPLLDSIKEKFNEFGITNTDFMTYQKLIRMSDEDIAKMDYKLIFLDEAHHCVAPVWGQKINYLIETHSDSIVFGTSATTVRNDGVNVVDAVFGSNAVGELPLSTAIARKVLPCPHYITAIYRLDDEFEKLKKRIETSTNTKDEKKEFYEKMKMMQSHFEKSYGVPLILNKYIKVKDGRYLVFCKNKKHLDSIRDVVIDWFHTAGIKDIHSYAVYSDYPDKEKDFKEFQEDNSDSLKILFSINMLNEGLHIEDISGVLMLRTTQSNTIYLQQLGRLIDADNMDKYLLVFDFVNNFSSVNDGFGLLKEIKDAVAREKESDPDFDDSGFKDIDTFFVTENVVQIQEMFAEIEGRLCDDWDAMFREYCKFYEENGHGDVPKTEEYKKIKIWCQTQRKNLKSGELKENRKRLLDEKSFIWNVPQYRFEKYLKEVAEYRKKCGYPSAYSSDIRIKQLGCFIDREKTLMRKNEYPEWKKNLIETYLPEFSCKYQDDEAFEKFVYYVTLYKERNGHVNIKTPDIINDYRIGMIFSSIKQKYNNNKLLKKQINKLCNLGICLNNTHQEKFDSKINLSKEAIKDGVIISSVNQVYKDTNLYSWINSAVKRRFYEDKLSTNEISIIETLINKPLNSFFNHCGSFIKIVDLKENRSIGIYSSFGKTVEAIRQQFGLKMNSISPIYDRVSGRTSTPYKGRFMFYYATNEEVKKYLSDNKVS